MSVSIFEKFEKVQQSWANNKKSVSYGDISKKNLFELAYHSSNNVPLRCIHIITKAGEDDAGNKAVIFSALDKYFTLIEGTDDAIEITMYVENDSVGFEKLDQIIEKLNGNAEKFKTRSENLQDQIAKTILVERKIDEVVNLAMNKELARKVYFAIGEARERGALIPLIMHAEKADIVQLAIMKWMNSTLNDPQDNPFPESKTKGLIKNFLQIKEWITKLVDKSFTADEKALLEDKSGSVEDETPK